MEAKRCNHTDQAGIGVLPGDDSLVDCKCYLRSILKGRFSKKLIQEKAVIPVLKQGDSEKKGLWLYGCIERRMKDIIIAGQPHLDLFYNHDTPIL